MFKRLIFGKKNLFPFYRTEGPQRNHGGAESNGGAEVPISGPDLRTLVVRYTCSISTVSKFILSPIKL